MCGGEGKRTVKKTEDGRKKPGRQNDTVIGSKMATQKVFPENPFACHGKISRYSGMTDSTILFKRLFILSTLQKTFHALRRSP